MKTSRPAQDKLPPGYRFAKYLSTIFAVGVLILALVRANPGKSIAAVAGDFSWLLAAAGIFIYLSSMMVERKANNLLRAGQGKNRQETDLRTLLDVANRVTATRDLRRISRLALACAVSMIPLRKGFLAVARDNGELEVTATWHISPARARITARRLSERNFSPRADDREGDPAPDPEREHRLLIRLPGKSDRPAGILAVFPTAGRVTSRQQDMLELLARGVGPAIQNEILRLRLERLSVLDSLTDLYNHRYYCEHAAREINRAKRFSHPVAVMISDIDNFKRHVDTHGHLTADKTLRELSRLVKGGLRGSDMVGRWGGDEFAYLLPHTGKAGAIAVASKIQRKLGETRFTGEADGALTLSFGIALFPEDGEEWYDLLEKADKALFRAKSLGKNRTCAFGEL